mmetsp:Transcript_10196/g.19089  ORF Transcript_10196/g.19089 Transcript_10196/m.19089 type:complete len:419 (+) Transcript_10196:3491-4747(+)
MRPSQKVLRPVVTLLSECPRASVKAAEVLYRFFNMEHIDIMNTYQSSEMNRLERRLIDGDSLDKALLPYFRRGFHSVGCLDKGSGTIFHLLSPGGSSNTESTTSAKKDKYAMNYLSLLSITETGKTAEHDDVDDDVYNCIASIQEARDIIALNMDKSTLNSLKVMAMQVLNKPVSPSYFTSLNNGLPLLIFPKRISEADANSTHSDAKFKLREIAIPYDDESTYPDGLTLLQSLSKSTLSRPKTGLFQWKSASASFAIRPLPIAKVDLNLPSPSMIFQCESLDKVQSEYSRDVNLNKVGYNSITPGQLMVGHEDLQGIDLRYCQSKELSSMFPEAQESLMAGSLDDLQNVNVMVKGGNAQSSNDQVVASRTRIDSLNGLGDCWVEFRANLKRPMGYFEGKSRRKSVQRTAKAPDLPYE